MSVSGQQHPTGQQQPMGQQPMCQPSMGQQNPMPAQDCCCKPVPQQQQQMQPIQQDCAEDPYAALGTCIVQCMNEKSQLAMSCGIKCPDCPNYVKIAGDGNGNGDGGDDGGGGKKKADKKGDGGKKAKGKKKGARR